MNLPYFSRVWVIQEVAFARDLMLRVGETEIPWDTLTSSCGLPEHLPRPGEVFGAQVHNLMEMRRWYQGQERRARCERQSLRQARSRSTTTGLPSIGVLKKRQLPALMRAKREFNACLWKDKLFALLSLVEEDLLRPHDPNESSAARQPDYMAADQAIDQWLCMFVRRMEEESNSENEPSDGEVDDKPSDRNLEDESSDGD